jgi:hypothetical protein
MRLNGLSGLLARGLAVDRDVVLGLRPDEAAKQIVIVDDRLLLRRQRRHRHVQDFVEPIERHRSPKCRSRSLAFGRSVCTAGSVHRPALAHAVLGAPASCRVTDIDMSMTPSPARVENQSAARARLKPNAS